MKFSFQIEKTELGVVVKPLFSSDQEQLSKLKQNTSYVGEFKQDRNSKFHRKLMALFNLGYENQSKIVGYNPYRKLVMVKAGYYEAVTVGDVTVYLADSISFSAMDQIEIEEVFNRVLDVISEQLDSSPTLIKENLELFM